jgi:hypothetical protein
MSLAMTAASIDNNEYQNEDTPISRKKQANNRTQKRIPTSEFIRPEKVKSVLNSIHNSQTDESENLGDFNAKYTSVKTNYQPISQINPYAPPVLTRQKHPQQEGMANKNDYEYDANTNNSNNYSSQFVPQPVQDDNMDLQELQGVYMNDEQVKKYFKNLVPNYDANAAGAKQNNDANKMYYNQTKFSNGSSNNSSMGLMGNDQVLIEKLNYMINLLEDQQDERTNNVTEEVVLYSFLGVFIIFVVDSFARVSKYVR